MQRLGTEAIRTQLQPSKPKREITNIAKSQNTKRTIVNRVKRWPLGNKNRTRTQKVKRHRKSETKTGYREPQQNYRLGKVSNELLGA